MKLNIQLFGGRGASSGTSRSIIKTKGDTNIIPRDFKQAYGRFKIQTNANESINDRFSVYKNEFGEIEMKNMENGRIYAGNMSALRNRNVFEFETKKK